MEREIERKKKQRKKTLYIYINKVLKPLFLIADGAAQEDVLASYY